MKEVRILCTTGAVCVRPIRSGESRGAKAVIGETREGRMRTPGSDPPKREPEDLHGR